MVRKLALVAFGILLITAVFMLFLTYAGGQ